jgi:hypothetical protein
VFSILKSATGAGPTTALLGDDVFIALTALYGPSSLIYAGTASCAAGEVFDVMNIVQADYAVGKIRVASMQFKGIRLVPFIGCHNFTF